MTVYSPNEPDRRPDRDDAAESTPDERRREPAETMADASHTNPFTGESFGDSLAYSRGRVAVVDGGEADAAENDEEETIGDIDHTPREDAPDAAEVYERGGEGEGERAEPEEDSDAEDEPVREVSGE